MAPTTKMLGDAGEHYAVCRFTFASRPATKMPDGWRAYDLAVESGAGLVTVSVKTRSESDGGPAPSGSSGTAMSGVSGWSSCLSRELVRFAHG